MKRPVPVARTRPRGRAAVDGADVEFPRVYAYARSWRSEGPGVVRAHAPVLLLNEPPRNVHEIARLVKIDTAQGAEAAGAALAAALGSHSSIRSDTARIVEFAAEAAELTAGERSAALAEAAKARASGYEADDARLPRHHPGFSTLLTTEKGEVWVQRINRDRADSITRAVYDVFSGDGYYLGTLPARFSAFPPPHVSRTLIAGLVRDSLGEESVEVWRVVRQRAAIGAEPPR